MSATDNPAKQEILESEMRLSECLLWRLQEQYFQESGIAAWKEVPFHITSNPFIARVYAEVIVAFLLDYGSHLDPSEPVHILELGGGTGVFAFYFMKELQAQKDSFATVDGGLSSTCSPILPKRMSPFGRLTRSSGHLGSQAYLILPCIAQIQTRESHYESPAAPYSLGDSKTPFS
jgi:hypothetical protein